VALREQGMTDQEIGRLEQQAREEIARATEQALADAPADGATGKEFVYVA
jgi:hypothetical protein